MAAASRDVNKWKRNLTQEMSTEPEDESEPDEPEFETSFRFQQEGDRLLVLVQLLLLKDEGSKTLDETSFFQQLLKPDLVKTVLLSRLLYLGSTD